LARRPKRRSTSRKRPPTPNATRPSGPASTAAPVEAVPQDEAESQPVAAPSSFLPRRSGGPAPAPATSTPAPAAPAVIETAAATASFLPKRARPAGRAERQRQQQAHLEPLDDSPAVPTDRTPYLWLDLRRVMLVSGVMVVMVVVGFFILH